MRDAAAGVDGPAEARVRHALAAAKLLCDSGGEYFVANPSAKEILGTMLEMGIAYTAHEFFGPHWHPMYFADVAREAAEHGLRFVGQLPLRLNYGDLAIAPLLQDTFRSLSDRRQWESARAFASNEFFRRDVYVKGPVPRGESTTREYLDATAFGTLVPAGDVRRELALPGRTLRFTAPLFEAVISTLAARTSTVAELARVPTLSPFGADAIRSAVLELLMGGDVIPMAHAQTGHAASSASYLVPSPFNRAALSEALSRKSSVVLASPVAGTGVSLSILQAVALRAVTEVAAEGRAAWLRAFVETSPLRLWDHGRKIVQKDELANVLGAQVEQFHATRLPKLLELGVVTRETS